MTVWFIIILSQDNLADFINVHHCTKREKSLIFLLVKDMKAPQDSYSSKGKLCKFIMHFRYRWLYWSWSLYFAHAWSQSSHVTHKVWKINLQKVCVITLQGQSLKHKALLHPSCLELSLLHIGIFFAQLLWLKKKKKVHSCVSDELMMTLLVLEDTTLFSVMCNHSYWISRQWHSWVLRVHLPGT